MLLKYRHEAEIYVFTVFGRAHFNLPPTPRVPLYVWQQYGRKVTESVAKRRDGASGCLTVQYRRLSGQDSEEVFTKALPELQLNMPTSTHKHIV